MRPRSPSVARSIQASEPHRRAGRSDSRIAPTHPPFAAAQRRLHASRSSGWMNSKRGRDSSSAPQEIRVFARTWVARASSSRRRRGYTAGRARGRRYRRSPARRGGAERPAAHQEHDERRSRAATRGCSGGSTASSPVDCCRSNVDSPGLSECIEGRAAAGVPSNVPAKRRPSWLMAIWLESPPSDELSQPAGTNTTRKPLLPSPCPNRAPCTMKKPRCPATVPAGVAVPAKTAVGFRNVAARAGRPDTSTPGRSGSPVTNVAGR